MDLLQSANLGLMSCLRLSATKFEIEIFTTAATKTSSSTNASRQVLQSYTIRSNSINLKIKGTQGEEALYMSPKVIEITEDDKQGKNNVQIEGRWHYHPEDVKGGRRNFHGENELFLSNHVDTQLPESIEGKCNVRTFEKYLKLDEVEDTDYFIGCFTIRTLNSLILTDSKWTTP
uniref:BAH domain-containing protein n=1 Tax=Kalanchoe fedtschenkoi TaxID=63787 RepID=A0A7N0UKE7_KALFE